MFILVDSSRDLVCVYLPKVEHDNSVNSIREENDFL